MNRKGDVDFMQLVLTLFFVFLLIVAVFILSTDKRKLTSTRAQLGQDLTDQRGEVVLTSLMRTPIRSQPLADIIILNSDGKEVNGKYAGEYDDTIVQLVDASLKPLGAYEFSVAYP